MAELLFPLAAIALVSFVLTPALTILSLSALRRRRRRRSWAGFGGAGTFAWLVLPSALPALWLISSALHQSEPGRGEACLIEHGQATTCLDGLLLLGFFSMGLLLTFGRAIFKASQAKPTLLPSDHPIARRVARIAQGALDGYPVVVALDTPTPALTMGWLRPRVLLRVDFVEAIDDAALHAVLLHEHAHIIRRDTLRDLLAYVCLALNPMGRWLEPDLQRWRAAREALCDGQAVRAGGAALALAEGILKATRAPRRGLSAHAIALCGYEIGALKLRIALLLEGPAGPSKSKARWALLICFAVALIAPHLGELDLLGRFHFEIERLLHPAEG